RPGGGASRSGDVEVEPVVTAGGDLDGARAVAVVLRRDALLGGRARLPGGRLRLLHAVARGDDDAVRTGLEPLGGGEAVLAVGDQGQAHRGLALGGGQELDGALVERLFLGSDLARDRLPVVRVMAGTAGQPEGEQPE